MNGFWFKAFYKKNYWAIFPQKGLNKNSLEVNFLVKTSLFRTLFFEVTENALMNEMEHCIQTLNALKRLGSHISIDDFGMDYSSLAYLSKLPVDNLKIDLSFINDMLRDSNDTAITLAIISLAQSLGLKVLAEGVEDQAQLKFLKQHNCEYIQGFLVSPSKPDRAFISFLKSYNH
mgnify:CR=1 FL=1